MPINERIIDADQRVEQEFVQRNQLLTFFMNKTTYELQTHLVEIYERHEGDCVRDEDGSYCNVCEFVKGNGDIIGRIHRWCECGHIVTTHAFGISGIHKCWKCECPDFNELKLNLKEFREEYPSRERNCVWCGGLFTKEYKDSQICNKRECGSLETGYINTKGRGGN